MAWILDNQPEKKFWMVAYFQVLSAEINNIV